MLNIIETSYKLRKITCNLKMQKTFEEYGYGDHLELENLVKLDMITPILTRSYATNGGTVTKEKKMS
jgi:hypothetical protein